MKKLSRLNNDNQSLRGKNTLSIILQMKTFWISLSLLFGTILLLGIVEVFVPHIHYSVVLKTRVTKSNTSVEAEVIRIASKFICACGDCSGDTLTICKCKYAIAERNLIRELLTKNINEVEIVKTINLKFSGLKNVPNI